MLVVWSDEGRKVTFSVHPVPGLIGTFNVQLLVWLKKDGFAPVSARDVRVSGDVPVFVTVTV